MPSQFPIVQHIQRLVNIPIGIFRYPSEHFLTQIKTFRWKTQSHLNKRIILIIFKHLCINFIIHDCLLELEARSFVYTYMGRRTLLAFLVICFLAVLSAQLLGGAEDIDDLSDPEWQPLLVQQWSILMLNVLLMQRVNIDQNNKRN